MWRKQEVLQEEKVDSVFVGLLLHTEQSAMKAK